MKRIVHFVQSTKNKEKEINTLPFVLFFITQTNREKENFMSNRKTLTLEQKIALIKDNQNGHGLSVRQLGDKYGVSKSSAAGILNRSEEFLSDYTSNCNKGIKRKYKDETGQTIDQLVFEWFTIQRAKQIPISGPILQKKAGQVAENLGYSLDDFKASNGWLL